MDACIQHESLDAPSICNNTCVPLRYGFVCKCDERNLTLSARVTIKKYFARVNFWEGVSQVRMVSDTNCASVSISFWWQAQTSYTAEAENKTAPLSITILKTGTHQILRRINVWFALALVLKCNPAQGLRKTRHFQSYMRWAGGNYLSLLSWK